jgi:hypothetical protein
MISTNLNIIGRVFNPKLTLSSVQMNSNLVILPIYTDKNLTSLSLKSAALGFSLYLGRER